MKGLLCFPVLSFGLFLLVTSFKLHAEKLSDAGARDVTVALFSTHTVHAATLTPLGSNAWTASCTSCLKKPLTASRVFKGPGDIFAGGRISVRDDDSGQAQTAAGLWHLHAGAPLTGLDIVLRLPSERYVAAVLNAEAAAGEPAQSLRALAIVARTYAMNGAHYTAAPGHLTADVCDSTQCQAIRLGATTDAVEQAVRTTAGETLWSGSKRAEVFFGENCGGLTEDAGVVWPKLRGVTYLHSHADPYCLRKSATAWHAEISLVDFATLVQREHWRIPSQIIAARIDTRSASHRAVRLVFTDRAGSSWFLSASSMRFGVGRSLGWNLIRSDAYDLGLRNGRLVFDGHGYGHGVGLCQAGASEMASDGNKATTILTFYFPGTVVRISPGDEGWHETRLDSPTGRLTLRSIMALTSAQRSDVLHAWQDAQRRFPSRRQLNPEVTFAPSTELFRQLTTQPGWTLASTQQNTIVLQPEAILKAHQNTTYETLLHEMLHALVEDEATAGAPLWLREGLVETLAGETAHSTLPVVSRVTTTQINDALQHPDSWEASRRGHLLAAALVRTMIGRYGASAVRGWLSSGPPAGDP